MNHTTTTRIITAAAALIAAATLAGVPAAHADPDPVCAESSQPCIPDQGVRPAPGFWKHPGGSDPAPVGPPPEGRTPGTAPHHVPGQGGLNELGQAGLHTGRTGA